MGQYQVSCFIFQTSPGEHYAEFVVGQGSVLCRNSFEVTAYEMYRAFSAESRSIIWRRWCNLQHHYPFCFV